jgi:IclR family transcriptional regulator, acetate operon repressor
MAESKGVQSVARALELLELVASAGDEIALSELARRAGLQPPTAHRLLQTLAEREWVVQNPRTSRYRLSHKLLSLVGDIEARTARLRSLSRPHLEAIRDAADESTNLVVLDGLAAVYVDQVPSSRPMRMFTEIGGRVPAYASGAGKAMLAFQSPASARTLLARARLRPLTPHTLTDRDELQAELERARERGYALDNEEYEPGVVCVAAPILADDATALAAISVSGPAARIREIGLDALGARLVEHAHDISRELGYTPATT